MRIMQIMRSNDGLTSDSQHSKHAPALLARKCVSLLLVRKPRVQKDEPFVSHLEVIQGFGAHLIEVRSKALPIWEASLHCKGSQEKLSLQALAFTSDRTQQAIREDACGVNTAQRRHRKRQAPRARCAVKSACLSAHQLDGGD